VQPPAALWIYVSHKAEEIKRVMCIAVRLSAQRVWNPTARGVQIDIALQKRAR
jgi:hypothetical protein